MLFRLVENTIKIYDFCFKSLDTVDRRRLEVSKYRNIEKKTDITITIRKIAEAGGGSWKKAEIDKNILRYQIN